VCATDEPVEENTIDLPQEQDGVQVRKAGSKRPASKKVQQEGKKRIRSVQIKASNHKHIPNINHNAFYVVLLGISVEKTDQTPVLLLAPTFSQMCKGERTELNFGNLILLGCNELVPLFLHCFS
jgi:hypothetical protein